MKKSKLNSAKADLIKRQAKKLRKELGIPYHAALDVAARSNGNSNWKNFLNNDRKVTGIESEKPFIIRPTVVLPSTLGYQMFPSKRKDRRPNAKMPIAIHQEVAILLKEALAITGTHKRVHTSIGIVRTTLDDWVQLEYNTDELPTSVFQEMYYGGLQFKTEESPSQNRRMWLASIIDQIQRYIECHYHDCQPVRYLTARLEAAMLGIDKWPKLAFLPVRSRRFKPFAPGTFVRFKRGGSILAVIEHSSWDDMLICYGDMGIARALGSEVSLIRNQPSLSTFKPKKMWLPYGKWNLDDGSQVLFNRDYCPLWVRDSKGKVYHVEPDTWIDRPKAPIFIFKDKGRPSWETDMNISSIQVLSDWGVLNAKPMLLNCLQLAINASDSTLLAPSNVQKKLKQSDLKLMA